MANKHIESYVAQRKFPLYVQTHVAKGKVAATGAGYSGIIEPHGLISGAFVVTGHGRAETTPNEVNGDATDRPLLARDGDMEISIDDRGVFLMRAADFAAVFTKRVQPVFSINAIETIELDKLAAVPDREATVAKIIAHASKRLTPDGYGQRHNTVRSVSKIVHLLAAESLIGDEQLRKALNELKTQAAVAGLSETEIETAVKSGREEGETPWRAYESRAVARMVAVREDFEVPGSMPDEMRPMTTTRQRPALIEKESMLLQAADGNVYILDSLQHMGWKRAVSPAAEPIVGVEAEFEDQARKMAIAYRASDAAAAAEAKLHMLDLAAELQTMREDIDLSSSAAEPTHWKTAALTTDGRLPDVFESKSEAIQRPRDNREYDFPTVNTLSDWLARQGVAVPSAKVVDGGLYRGGKAVIAHFRQVFGAHTDVPLEDISVYYEPVRQPRPDTPLAALIAYAKGGKEISGPQAYDFKNMPGYRSMTDGVFNRDGVDYYIVRDSSGTGVYFWPDKTSLRMQMDAHLGRQTEAEKNRAVRVVGADDGLEDILAIADFRREARPVVDETVYATKALDHVGAQRAAVWLTAPWLVEVSKSGTEIIELRDADNLDTGVKGRFRGIAFREGAETLVVAPVGITVTEKMRASVEAHWERVALPSPAPAA